MLTFWSVVTDTRLLVVQGSQHHFPGKLADVQVHRRDHEARREALSAGHSQTHHRWGMSHMRWFFFFLLFSAVFVLYLHILESLTTNASRSKSSQICTEHKSCEIDPVKLKESENLETNRVRGGAACDVAFDSLWPTEFSDSGCWPPQENLRHYVDRIFNVITTSGVRCPTVMCDIFFSLRESAATRFQGNRYILVGFFCIFKL